MKADDEFYHRLIKSMSEGFAHCRMVLDDVGAPVDFEYLEVNDAFGRLTGLSDVEGMLVSDVIPGIRETNPELLEVYGRVALTGEPVEFETSVHSLGLELQISAYRSEPGSFVAIFTDITGRKRAEADLRASEERFAELFEQAPLGYQSLDEDGRFLEVNEMWLDTLGFAREEVLGAWFGDFLAPEFVEPFRERFPLFKERGAIHSEFQMLHKSGARRTIAFEGRIAHHADGTFKQTHCILTDITERARAEAALRESEDTFKFLFERSVVASSLTSPGGEIRVNDAFRALLGYNVGGTRRRRDVAADHPPGRRRGERGSDRLTHRRRSVVRAVREALPPQGWKRHLGRREYVLATKR
ncbi:MAG: PAS domain S-box protein [Coriobacteriia bacterium]|nr:PAS domain S-box protein [Coriobacteriia bacterium]